MSEPVREIGLFVVLFVTAPYVIGFAITVAALPFVFLLRRITEASHAE